MIPPGTIIYDRERGNILRDLTEPLTDAGFVIERLCEPTPVEQRKLRDPKGYDRVCRLQS
jgi:hypothetical protein